MVQLPPSLEVLTASLTDGSAKTVVERHEQKRREANQITANPLRS
jgi:hypothetical protein